MRNAQGQDYVRGHEESVEGMKAVHQGREGDSKTLQSRGQRE